MVTQCATYRPSAVASPIGWVLAIQVPLERVVRDTVAYAVHLVFVADDTIVAIALPQSAWERYPSVLAYADHVFMGADRFERLDDPAHGLW